MPFKIIQNDITKITADIIVNTANPNPVYGSGTDYAIYKAAGKSQLLRARGKIGKIRRGEIAVTDAYNLSAKYIIHTVGPVWKGGKSHEFEILESCYWKSLKKAAELNCESIAFPLIATGVYGFPKDMALEIAVSTFGKFLAEHEMNIILAVFDKESFQLSSQIVDVVDSYIDENYVNQNYAAEYSQPFRRDRRSEYENRNGYPADEFPEGNFYEASFSKEALGWGEMFLEEQLNQIGPSFHEKLFELIERSGMDNKDVWKAANLDRKHFSKIQCDSHYHPKKKTVMALCIALKLNLEQAKDLLARADWAFSPSSKVDLIVQKALIDRQYDIMQLNTILFKYTNEILGV